VKAVKRATTAELQQLYQALAALCDPRDIEALLADMCTIREIDEMAGRLNVANLLASEQSYTTITEKTGASATTIARVAKALNYGAGGYRRVLGE
jgi:TrpR-related protein YerC/YecD